MTLLARFPGFAGAMRKKAAKNTEMPARRAIPDAVLREQTLNDPEAGPLLRANLLRTMERMADRLAGTRNDIMQSRLRFAYPVERIAAPVLIVHGDGDSNKMHRDVEQASAAAAFQCRGSGFTISDCVYACPSTVNLTVYLPAAIHGPSFTGVSI